MSALAVAAVAAVGAEQASAARRADRPTIRVRKIALTKQPEEESEVEVRALIEPHGLPTTYEVWFVGPELLCEDLEGCPQYEPSVIKTGSIASAATTTFRDEVSLHYKEEIWFVASNADGTTTSRHVKLSKCHLRYCRY